MATIDYRLTLGTVAAGGGATRTFSVTLGSGTSRKLIIWVANESDASSATFSSATFDGTAMTLLFAENLTTAGNNTVRTAAFYYDIPDGKGAASYNVVVTLSADSGLIARTAWITSGQAVGAPQYSVQTGSAVGTIAASISAQNADALLTVATLDGTTDWNTPPSSSQVTFANASTASGAGFRIGKADALGDATETVTATWTLSSGTDGLYQALINMSPAPSAPTITTQPTAQTARINGESAPTATFTVAATSSGGSLTYDWELETSVGGGVYANLADGSGATWTGQTSASCVGTFTAKTLSGRRVRCNVTDSNGTTTTDAVVLTVLDGPVLSASTATTNGSGVASVTATTDDVLSANGELYLVTASINGTVIGRTTFRGT